MNASLQPSASRRLGTRLCWLLGLCVSAACFVDPLDLEGDDTQGAMCVAGEIGCACDADASCQESLSCLVEEDVCVPSGCAPGSAFCTCDDEACDGALSCAGGICIPPGDDDGVAGSSDTADADADADAGDATTGSGGPRESTDGSTGAVGGSSGTGGSGDATDDDATGDDAPSSDTGPDVDCTDALSCGACFLCASAPAQQCQAEGEACQGVGGCMVVAQCLQGCSADGLCLDDCCAGASGAAVTAAHALDHCRRDACATAITCGDFNDAPCSG